MKNDKSWDSGEKSNNSDMNKAKALADEKGSAPGGDACLKVDNNWSKVPGQYPSGRGK